MTDAQTTEKAGRIRDGIDTARDAASNAFGSSRETAVDLAHRTAQGVETNPLGILVGGIAIGALIGALIPRTDREKDLLAPLGKRIGDTAKAATQAAKDAGQNELASLGLTKDAARGQVKSLFEGVVQAITTAGAAAAKTASPKAAE